MSCSSKDNSELLIPPNADGSILCFLIRQRITDGGLGVDDRG